MAYVISGTEAGAITFPVADFESGARKFWNGAVEWVGTAGDGKFVADIQPSGQPGFSIRIDTNGEAIYTDGTREQVADVAIWALSLLPENPSSDVLLYDFNGHSVLHQGMKESDVWAGWTEA